MEQRWFPKTAALVALAAVAMIAVWMLARPAHAEAGAGLLAGSPRIETVRALVPRKGRDAGRVVVWVRVDHASGTRRAVARKRPETFHMGRVTARIGGVSRVATRPLDLDRRRTPGGYYFRFPRSSVRAMKAQAVGSVSVSVRVAQTVDLDSDGNPEDRAATSTTQRVPLARPEQSIEPQDGDYENSAGDTLTVKSGYVTYFFFISGASSPCGVGPANTVQAPIDPVTGEFSFTSSNQQISPPVSVAAMGTFSDNTDTSLDASVTFGSCIYDVSPAAFSFTL
jgi:hypothetical protein